jgi:transglutaminase/protease-like cytokinesis protein 3
MSRQAGFETEYVAGYTKGKSKYVIQPVGQFVRHAWNLVKINDIYYLVDTTWDAGYVNGNQFRFAYTTDFFLTDPETFVKRHYPQAPGFLLTDNYVSIDDFKNMKL